MKKYEEYRKQALEWLLTGINAVHPRECIPQNLQFNVDQQILKVQDKKFHLSKDPELIAIGKASLEMAKETLTIIPTIKQGIIVTQDKEKEQSIDERIEIFRAEHPVPGKGSLKAGKRIKQFLINRKPEDVLIFLLSGGGSSLLAYPKQSISMKDKVMMTEILLQSGATIHEINCLRKHVSQVKGGQLAYLSYPALLLTLAISDVPGNNPQIIASGPSYPDSSTYKDAMQVIEKYSLKEKLPESILNHIIEGVKGKYPETPKKGNKRLERAHYFIIASNRIACEAIAKKVTEKGIDNQILTTQMQGEAKKMGKSIANIAKQQLKQKERKLTIWGGETTVRLSPQPGKGGRNQEFACSLLSAMDESEEGWLFSAIGTDGVDGNSPAAGAIVDQETWREAKSKDLNPEVFIDAHNTYEFFKQTDSLITTSPTGTNVADIALLWIWK
ncbi:MAG: glycerate kinase [Promethearchaeota archaeon]